MDIAVWEQRQWNHFDYVVKNGDGKLEETVESVAEIVETTRMKVV